MAADPMFASYLNLEIIIKHLFQLDLITLSPMKVAKENQRQFERFLQSEAGQSVSQIFVSSTVNIIWPGIRVAKSDLNSTEAYFATKN